MRLALAEIEVARGRFPDDERLAELRAETEQKLTASGGALTESRRGVPCRRLLALSKSHAVVCVKTATRARFSFL